MGEKRCIEPTNLHRALDWLPAFAIHIISLAIAAALANIPTRMRVRSIIEFQRNVISCRIHFQLNRKVQLEMLIEYRNGTNTSICAIGRLTIPSIGTLLDGIRLIARTHLLASGTFSLDF